MLKEDSKLKGAYGNSNKVCTKDSYLAVWVAPAKFEHDSLIALHSRKRESHHTTAPESEQWLSSPVL